MNLKIYIVAVCAFSATTQSLAGLTDFLVMSNSGNLYEVDGMTLEATEVAQIPGGGFSSDLVYIGDGDVLVNTGGGFVRYDTRTRSQSIEFINSLDFPEPSLVDIGNGAAITSEGNVYFTTVSSIQEPRGTSTRGLLYNPNTQEITHLASLQDSDTEFVYNHDYHEIGENLFLSADGNNPKLRVYNSLTGDLEYEFDSTEGFVTFVELGPTLFGLTRNGSMYSIDESTGLTEYHGQVTGVANSVFGATLPSPSTAIVLGSAFGIQLRRRR